MVTEVFAGYTAMIAGALQKIGIDAVATGRNDITIGGKKVSGNAFYHLPGRSIAPVEARQRHHAVKGKAGVEGREVRANACHVPEERGNRLDNI